MRNARRRRQILVFSVLLASCTNVMEDNAFKQLYQAIFRYIGPLDEAYTKAVPIKKERDAELNRIKMVVNSIVPTTWQSSNDSWKLWFVLQLVKRYVGSGWRPDRTDELACQFIQSLYNVADNFDLQNPPPVTWLNRVIAGMDVLKKHRLFD